MLYEARISEMFEEKKSEDVPTFERAVRDACRSESTTLGRRLTESEVSTIGNRILREDRFKKLLTESD
jgi:hypothetical protein